MSSAATEIPQLRTIADYQFGAGAGTALLADPESIDVRRSTSGRPRQLLAPDGRLATLGGDGRFTLGFAGGRRLHDALPSPDYRLRVDGESEPFVRDGENAFAKFVTDADPTVRPYDEVLVLDAAGALIGVGRAELAGAAMLDFERGVAVSIREGRSAWSAR